MITYISLLRGINIRGQKIIKMQDLAKLFESFGFNNVKTYLQTGNVLFDSDETETLKLTNFIEEKLFTELGYKVTVIIRTKQDLLDIVEQNPFKDYAGDVKYYITFLAEKPKQAPTLPIRMNEIENEVFKMENNNVFTVGFNVKGRYGFPNVFIEKEFCVPATTRNWNTILRILK
ncbi:MAG: DUF1697 domain-containing protein [Planctomycetia bacterium]|nr:DUF1697 domain-containing protein [Planctomycetia bacterium]